ncbi:hypothetical protein [Kineococcus sp. SYSU DK002]|uniref:hypothetical protein n=1 Tax=Kineococcus sp. SYSU DK002 TaxID=3383123 RepID=UPI003D7E4187
MVDDLVRDQAIHAPTVGILLVADRDEQIVRFALSGSSTPLAVADCTDDSLPPETRAALPDSDHLQALLSQTVDELTDADGLVDDLPGLPDHPDLPEHGRPDSPSQQAPLRPQRAQRDR